MKLYRAELPKNRLAAIPTEERTFFLALGHFANEVNILQKVFYWSSEWADSNEFVIRAHTVQAMVMARLLVGKLNEGWNLLEKAYFARQLGQEYGPMLNEPTKLTLQKLKNYFGKENLINVVRNDFAFHYSPGNLDEGFHLPPEDEKWEMYLAESNANSLYYASELVTNYSLLESIHPGKHQKAMEDLISESIRVAGWFTDVSAAFMIAFAEKHLVNEDGEFKMSPLDIGKVPKFDEVHIPFFVETAANTDTDRENT
jgi:hypothetical protein